MQALSINQFPVAYDPDMQQRGRPTERPRTDFGQRVFAARQALGLSQAEVAAKIGITQAGYAAWERDPVALRPEQIRLLVGVLNVSFEQLLGVEGKPVRQGGPTGKARRLFEQVSKLPRSQQQHVLTVLEAFVEKKVASS
jgi:transcriptional regulator with XRE-family HTH domain